MEPITIRSIIHVPIPDAWEYWTKEAHIKKWNFASPDWHCPDAKNDLREGGEFHYTMAAKDNSMQFDFWGTYHKISPESAIEIVLGDGRKVSVSFEKTDAGTVITERFEPEQVNPIDLQQTGWQMILDRFKQYAEYEWAGGGA
jgi:uncharacterized protein YndB with AHSA1/START domain